MTDDTPTREPLVALQKIIPAVLPNDLVTVLGLLRPILAEHGVLMMQSVEHLENGHIVVVTEIDDGKTERVCTIRMGASLDESRLECLALAFGFAIGEPPAAEPPKEFVAQPDVARPEAVPAEVWMHLAEEMKTKIGQIATRAALDDWYAANKTVIHIMENAPQGKEAHAVVEEVFKAKWRETAA